MRRTPSTLWIYAPGWWSPAVGRTRRTHRSKAGHHSVHWLRPLVPGTTVQYGNLKKKFHQQLLNWNARWHLKRTREAKTHCTFSFNRFKEKKGLRRPYHRPSLIPFIVNFLTWRKHRVRYNDVFSDWEDITCGVPQGTKLGPIIFVAIVNNVARNSNIHTKFVDDLTVRNHRY